MKLNIKMSRNFLGKWDNQEFRAKKQNAMFFGWKLLQWEKTCDLDFNDGT